MASIRYSEVRKGMVIVGEDGQLYYCVDRELKTPGNLPSKLTLRLKNLKTGFVNDTRVHPEDKVQQAYLDTRDMQYLYKDADGYVFMDKETFDQTTLQADLVEELIREHQSYAVLPELGEHVHERESRERLKLVEINEEVPALRVRRIGAGEA